MNDYLGYGSVHLPSPKVELKGELVALDSGDQPVADVLAIIAELEAKIAPAGPLESVKSLKDNTENQTPPLPFVCVSEASETKGTADGRNATGKEQDLDLNAEPEMLPKNEDLVRDPPPNEPGRIGICGVTGQRRLPTKNEFIDENGRIMPLGYWRTPKPQSKRRKLATLNSLADIERELAKLYADYHHFRIDAAHYTRGVYGLTQLATVMRMAEKGKAALESVTIAVQT